jgi:tetratricopeptide (TPR) repeat protein
VSFSAVIMWLLLLFWSSSWAFGAPAQPVKKVRFGMHGEYSRVVLDLRENAPYDIVPAPEPTTIRLLFPTLEQLPTPTVWRHKGPLIHEVVFTTVATQIVADITLAQAGSVAKHFVIASPPRIVVDIVPRSPATSSVTPAVPRPPGSDRQAPAATSSGEREKAVTTPPVSPPASGQLPERKKRAEPSVESSPALLRAETPPLNVPSQPVATASEPRAAGVVPPPAEPAAPAPAPVAEEAPVLKVAGSKPQPPVLSNSELLGLAEYQWRQGQLEKALKSYHAFLERFPGHSHNHLIAVRMADILRARQDYRGAIDAYARAVDAYPGTEGAFISQMHMAELGMQFPDLLPDKGFPRYFAYHHPFEALRNFIQTYPFSPLVDVAQFKIGTFYLARQELQAALDVFQELLRKALKPELQQEIRSKVRETLQAIIAEQQRGGRDREALQTYFHYKGLLEPATAVHPDFLFAVATSYARLGLLPEAQSLFQTLSPAITTPEQHIALGTELLRIFIQRGLLKEARAMLRKVETSVPAETRGQFLLSLGRLALQVGQTAPAVEYLRQGQPLLATAKQQAELFALLGDGYLSQGNVTEGLQALQRCVEVATAPGELPLPQGDACLFRSARLLEAQQQPQQALTAYQTLLQTFPSSVYRGEAALHIVDITQALGDAAQVQNTLTALRDTAPSTLWQKVATDALEEVAWRRKFHERLADFANHARP